MAAFPVEQLYVKTSAEARSMRQAIALPSMSGVPAAFSRFLMLSITAMWSMSLLGNVLAESARNEGKSIARRERAAEEAYKAADSALAAMTRTDAIQTWAKNHGFVAPDSLVHSSALPSMESGRGRKGR